MARSTLLLLACLAGCAADPKPEPTERPASAAASRPASRPAAPKPNQFAQAVADAYGFQQLDQVASIAFTFCVERPGKPTARRRWRWELASDTVTFGEGAKAVTYRRDQVDDAVRSVDARFTNDQFWLLFPFHLVWDDVQLAHRWKADRPLAEGQAERLVVTYPQVGGYTPGDVYEVFLDERRRLVSWVFRRGGKPEGRPLSWEQHRQAGPLLLSLSHRDAKRTIRVFFQDVAVETRDGTVHRVSAE